MRATRDVDLAEFTHIICPTAIICHIAWSILARVRHSQIDTLFIGGPHILKDDNFFGAGVPRAHSAEVVRLHGRILEVSHHIALHGDRRKASRDLDLHGIHLESEESHRSPGEGSYHFRRPRPARNRNWRGVQTCRV